MSGMRFGVNLHSIVAWMSRNFLPETDAVSEVSVVWTGFETTAT